MQSKAKLLLSITLLMLTLSVATVVNMSLNFREYSIKTATQKAETIADIVKDGLTAHMVNGIMDKRAYFLNQLTHNQEIESIRIVRSQNVIKQYGDGLFHEQAKDNIDKQVLETGKMQRDIIEDKGKVLLRLTIPYIAEDSLQSPSCLSCHDVKVGDVLGAISMEFDITSLRTDTVSTIIKIMSITLVFVLLALVVINYFITPYMSLFKDLQYGIKKAYRGDFTYEFHTSVHGEPKEFIDRLNILFRKMQEAFGDIKNDLGTFIPNNTSSQSKDPLYEAKTIIKELSDIYKFKKTIELDRSKDIVYSRLVTVLEHKYNIKHFAFYELNNITLHRKLIYITDGEPICSSAANNDSTLCRAHRTKTDVISTEFENLCQACEVKEVDYVCIPFSINKDHSLVISMTAKHTDDLNRIKSLIPSIKHYLDAAQPVIESNILMDKLRDTSLRDAMTGLYNRRFLEEFIDQVMKQVQRENETYTVLMLDVDFFKQVNDTYGHDVGDKVIAEIGNVVKNSIRESDLGIRYGGEEFVVLLHNATDEGAMSVAQKIHTSFAELVFDVGNGQTMKKTMSIGMAKYPTDGNTIWKCIKYADTALYVAKTTGRNKIVRYTPEMSDDDTLR